MLTAMAGHTLFEAAKNTIMEGGGLATLHAGFSLVGPQTGLKEALISHRGGTMRGFIRSCPRWVVSCEFCVTILHQSTRQTNKFFRCEF